MAKNAAAKAGAVFAFVILMALWHADKGHSRYEPLDEF